MPAVSTPVPLAGPQVAVFLLECGVLLAAALCLGGAARRFGLPAIVGELLAGVVLGPSLLGRVAPDLAALLFPPRGDQLHLLDALGQLAVVLLVGVTAMNLHLGVVRRRAATALTVSALSMLVPLALGVATGLVLPASMLGDPGGRAAFAALIGIAMSVSAIPVIARTLIDMRLLDRELGQLVLAAGVVDGTAGWLLLSVVSAMSGSGVRVASLALAVGSLVVALAVAPLAGRVVALVVRRVRHLGWGEDASVAALLLLAASATQAIGLEGVLGAFLCGAGLAGREEGAAGRTGALRAVVVSVLAPLYFALAGLRIDLAALGVPRIALSAVAVLGVAVVGKFAGACVGAWLSRLGAWEAVALGAGLNSRGIVEVVVASVGLRIGILNTASYTAVLLVAIATSLMAPPILRWAVSNLDRATARDAGSRPGVTAEELGGLTRPS